MGYPDKKPTLVKKDNEGTPVPFLPVPCPFLIKNILYQYNKTFFENSFWNKDILNGSELFVSYGAESNKDCEVEFISQIINER